MTNLPATETFPTMDADKNHAAPDALPEILPKRFASNNKIPAAANKAANNQNTTDKEPQTAFTSSKKNRIQTDRQTAQTDAEIADEIEAEIRAVSAPKHQTTSYRTDYYDDNDDDEEDFEALDALLEKRPLKNPYKKPNTAATTATLTDDQNNKNTPNDPTVPAGWFMRHENGRSKLVRIEEDPETMTEADRRAFWGFAPVEILPENATDKEKWSFLWRNQVTPASALPKEPAQDEYPTNADATTEPAAKKQKEKMSIQTTLDASPTAMDNTIWGDPLDHSPTSHTFRWIF